MKTKIKYKYCGNRAAKAIAIILFVITCFTTVFGAAAFWLMEDQGIYRKSREQYLKECYENAMDTYSIGAIIASEDDYGYNALKDTDFRYGVIRTSDFTEEMMLDPDAYDFQAFDGDFKNKKSSDLHLYSCWYTEHSSYSYHPTIFGSSWIGSYQGDEWIYRPIETVYYNWQNGTLYLYDGRKLVPYRGEIGLEDGSGGLYYGEPSAYFMITPYDSEEEAAEILDDSEIVELEAEVDQDETSDSNHKTDKDMSSGNKEVEEGVEKVKEITRSSSDGNSEKQKYRIQPIECDADSFFFTEDDYRMLLEDVIPVRTADLAKIGEIQDNDYIYENGFIGLLELTDYSEDTYYVVSYQAEEPASYIRFAEADLFAQYRMAADLLYRVRTAILPLTFLSFFLLIVSLSFITAGVGRKTGEEGLFESVLYRLPWDVELCLAISADIGLLALIFLGLDGFMSMDYYGCFFTPEPWLWIIGLGTIGILLTMIGYMALVYRIKERRFVRNALSLRFFPWMAAKLGVWFRSGEEILHSMSLHRFGWLLILLIIGLNWLMLLLYSMRWDLIPILYLGVLIPFLLILIGWKVLGQLDKIREMGEQLASGNLSARIDVKRYLPQLRSYAENLNAISDGIQVAVDERMKSEHFQTELITNVSHDIKTPLTSIVNYVDLLQKTEIQDPDAVEYLEVLSRQSAKLKKLIEDLIEASKASSGKLAVHTEELDAGVALEQAVGEFGEKLETKDVRLLVSIPDHPVMIHADSRHLWRVFDNLLNNICKYAMPGTRAYINIEEDTDGVRILFRNISRDQLNISGDELLQRFVRADASRHTEGNGLGLAISRSLMELMGGALTLTVDGDLFKVELKF